MGKLFPTQTGPIGPCATMHDHVLFYIGISHLPTADFALTILLLWKSSCSLMSFFLSIFLFLNVEKKMDNDWDQCQSYFLIFKHEHIQ